VRTPVVAPEVTRPRQSSQFELPDAIPLTRTQVIPPPAIEETVGAVAETVLTVAR